MTTAVPFATRVFNRVRRFRPDITTVLLIGLVVYLWFRPPASVDDERQPLPDLTFRTFDGKTLNTADLRGKVVLINFWATWCPYCHKEMPAIQQFYNDYRNKGFTVLALSMDEQPAQAFSYFTKERYSFTGAMLEPGQNSAFGEIKQLPTSLVVDKNGMIVKRVTGQVHYGRLEDLVKPLL